MTTTASSDTVQDAVTQRYDRIARFYDLIDKPMDLLGVGRRRKRLLSHANGRTLEVGVGTGRNLSLYPEGVQLTGIDVSPNMLGKAQRSPGPVQATSRWSWVMSSIWNAATIRSTP